MTTILYLVMIFPTVFVWAYLEGRSRRRFISDQSVHSRPPYLVGVFTAVLWPLQLMLGLGYLMWIAGRGWGDRDGVRVNDEVHRLRELDAGRERVDALIHQYLTKATLLSDGGGTVTEVHDELEL